MSEPPSGEAIAKAENVAVVDLVIQRQQGVFRTAELGAGGFAFEQDTEIFVEIVAKFEADERNNPQICLSRLAILVLREISASRKLQRGSDSG